MTQFSKLVLCLVLGLVASIQSWAEDLDPEAWIGLTPPGVYTTRGAPDEVFPMAVEADRWQVVHFYNDHSYLFFFQNHVWQVRLDRLWTGNWKGFTMGMSRDQVETLLGTPLIKGDTWSIWALGTKAYPRRLRLVFTEGVLADAYFYRSDL